MQDGISRRSFVAMTAAATSLGTHVRAAAATSAAPGLRSLTTGATPISTAERLARLARLQSLLQQRGLVGLLLESGSSLEYFTGIRWSQSERTTAALIRAEGDAVIVTPWFEAPSIHETLQIPGELRTWKEDQSPFDLLAGALRERARGPLAVSGSTRLFIVDGVRKSLNDARDVVLGEDLVRACREIKSPAEIALLQAANDVTLAALRHVHARVAVGMSGSDIEHLMIAATTALGGVHQFSDVLLNEASAFPHGSIRPQQVRRGSVVLIDTGCSVHGYQSDITRTWVFGEATPQQRAVWNAVKQGQELALATAKPGVPVGAVDAAVRALYEGKSWAKNRGTPGTSHRTGQGIGLDSHESPYLVRNDQTPFAPGMCFSDEPGICVPGEFGVRLEDCWCMTESGPKLFTPLATSIEKPV